MLGRDNHDIKMHQANDDVAYKGLMRYRFTCKKYMALHKNIIFTGGHVASGKYSTGCLENFPNLPRFVVYCAVNGVQGD